jgi:acyl carrier protein
MPVAPVAVGGQPTAVDPVVERVLGIVAEQTGYPLEMLDLDLDMEADLGIDTVKQAETFQAIRNAFDIPRRDDLKLRDYPTLGAVIGFVYAMRPDLAAATADHRPPTAAQPEPIAAPTVPAAVGGQSSAVDPVD